MINWRGVVNKVFCQIISKQYISCNHASLSIVTNVFTLKLANYSACFRIFPYIVICRL